MIIGIDNGTTGSIGIIAENFTMMLKTPTIEQQDYTVKKKLIKRLDFNTFYNLLKECKEKEKSINVVLERPMVNPGRFNATTVAVRCLEAQLIAIELLGLSYQFIDSKLWQRKLLPQGCKKEELKRMSHDIAIRLFPQCKEMIDKQKDGDSLLMAEYVRRYL